MQILFAGDVMLGRLVNKVLANINLLMCGEIQ